jgi:EAL domain-containing protein (putative c-di-GMP-specific phosphodiesterase class I)/ActR/RegA family two-component response regulator
MKTRPSAITVSQTLLIIDDEPEICTALATALNERGRHIIVCRDAEAAQFVIERFPITHVLTDIRLTGPFRFEGLDIIDQVKRHFPAASVVVLTGHSTDELQKEARKRGAVSVLQKPASIEEIEQFLPHPENDGESMLTILPSIDEILEGGLLHAQFQPIVWNEQPKHAVGFEALTRVRTESPLADPEVLFRYAQAKGRVVDLELAAAASSLKSGRELAGIGFISVNAHPLVFTEIDRFCDGIINAAAHAAVSPARLVLEITEQAPLPELRRVEAAATILRSHGVRFAFDDLGTAYSHLPSIAAVRPSYLKISQHFGTSCEANPAHRKIVENVQALAASFSSEVVLEGIETEETATFARDTGIRFGQGYFYSRPAESSALVARYS